MSVSVAVLALCFVSSVVGPRKVVVASTTWTAPAPAPAARRGVQRGEVCGEVVGVFVLGYGAEQELLVMLLLLRVLLLLELVLLVLLELVVLVLLELMVLVLMMVLVLVLRNVAEHGGGLQMRAAILARRLGRGRRLVLGLGVRGHGVREALQHRGAVREARGRRRARWRGGE